MTVDFRIVRAESAEIGTRGVLTDAAGNHLCYTLELPWLNNVPNISCVPKGVYGVVRHNGAKYKNVWRLLDVPGRSGILIHAGNTKADIQGCILVGLREYSLGVLDSRLAMDKLRSEFPETFVLEIV